MNKKIISIGIFLQFLIIVFSGCVENNTNQTTDESENNNFKNPSSDDNNQKNNEGKETEEISFSYHMFELDKVNYIVPLGELEGGWEEMEVNNMALVHIKKTGEYGTPSLKMEVYAPTDISLTSYSYYGYGGHPATWTVIFEINSDVTLRLSALTDVVDKIKNTVGTEYTSGEINLQNPISFSAGDLIGYAGGSVDVTNWDILLYDKNHENQFVNQDRYYGNYLGERYLTAICPFGFYADKMKQEYINLMGFTKAGEASDCGCASRDVKGTLSGTWWFTTNGTTIEEQGMYSQPLFIYSNSAGGTSLGTFNKNRYKITSDNPTNKDPATIIDEHCYNLLNAWDGSFEGYAYFKIISDTEMRLAIGTSGRCPDSFPDDYVTYYR